MASRYDFTDWLGIRGSLGTGFRAPTPGQIATINVSGRPGIDSDPFLVGVFPQSHPAALLFGAVPLEAETSWQWTVGLTSAPLDNLMITLDFYHIEVDDRLFMSSDFAVGPTERALLLATGVPGAASIEQVRFFTNDIDTETDGVDLVATYAVDWSAGTTDFSLSANWNETKVTRRTPRPGGFFFSDADVYDLENGSPRPRSILDVRHAWTDSWSVLLRTNYYGEYDVVNSRNVNQIQSYDSLVQVDVVVDWAFGDGRFGITIGGNNVFDEQPAPAEFGVCCGIIINRNSLIDWQGPFYYVRGRLRWN